MASPAEVYLLSKRRRVDSASAILGRFLQFGVLFPALAVLCFSFGSRWHVSSKDLAGMLRNTHIYRLTGAPPRTPLDDFLTISDLPRITLVDRVGALDAVMNTLSLAMFAASVALFAGAILVGSVGVMIWALCTGSWSEFLLGPIALMVMPPLMAILVPLLWLCLLLQKCTPGYALCWLVVGLPMILGAAMSAPAAYEFSTVATAGTARYAVHGTYAIGSGIFRVLAWVVPIR